MPRSHVDHRVLTRVLARLRFIATRGGRAVVLGFRTLARAWARRSAGALQGPLSPNAEIVRVWGWAHVPCDTIFGVAVTVDREFVASGDLGPPPPDVAASLPATLTSTCCGWAAEVDLRSWSEREVELGAVVAFGSGFVESLPPLRVRVGPLRLTTPRHDSVVTPGRVQIAGTLVDTPIARVHVQVDGADAGLARLYTEFETGTVDPSLEAGLAPLAGFQHTVSVAGDPGSTVVIEAEAVNLDGTRSALYSVSVKVGERSTTPVDTARLEQIRAEARSLAPTTSPPEASPAAVRLVAFTNQLDLGGGQLYLSELLRQLLPAPDVTCLVVSERDGTLRRELEALGAVVHITDYPTQSPEAYEERVLELAHTVRGYDANVAIVNSMHTALGADVTQLLEIPTIWAIHESFSLDEFWGAAYGVDGIHPYVRERHARALGHTAVVVFEADATREQYAPEGDPQRFVTLPYGIPIDAIDAYREGVDRAQQRRDAGISSGETVFLCMGTFVPRKSQGALAVAFTEVAARHPDAVLILVGAIENTYSEKVCEIVRHMGTRRIRCLPVVEDTYAWYSSADAFIIASDVESLPRSVLEAMTFEVPVIAASVFGLPELIEHQRNGLLFAPRDLAATIGALEHFLALPSPERAALGAAGSATVRAQYDSSGYAAAYDRLLRGLIERPQAFPGDVLSRNPKGRQADLRR